MPKDWCPFCPGSGRVPDDYRVHLYPNDFAAFSPDEEPFENIPAPYAVTGARGACDVVLYSPQHNQTPAQLSVDQWLDVIGLWTSRTEELYARPGIAYVAVFENQGEAIGVTMPHPHGQIYAVPVVPPLVKQELESAAEYAASHGGECLHCKLLESEIRDGARIVCQNEDFAAFVPFYGRFPTEVHLYSRRHVGRLAELTPAELRSFATLLSEVRQRYDGLYGFPMPMIMALRQRPSDASCAGYAHFHIQFLPVQRSANKLKFMAAIETAHGLFLNDTCAEDQAAQLRAVSLAGDAKA